jgi:hypothetical protein
MQRLRNQREGFALAVAIGAIVVIGALIAGVFFASTQQYRIGRNALLQARAESAAEYGLDAIFDTTQTTNRWNVHWNNQTPGVKDTMVFTSTGVVDTVFVTKVNTANFYIVSEARASGGRGAQARSRLGMLVPLRIPQLNMTAAFTTRGQVQIGGSTNLDGNDHTVSGWTCPPLDTALSGVTVANTDQIKCSGCSNAAKGNPPIRQDSTVAKDSTYNTFGDIDWATLKGMSKTYTANGTPAATFNADGSCKTSDPGNWGDPQHSFANTNCQDYFPIIYIPGDASLSGGTGQGILLVDGSLKLSGGFSFYGPVIVKGNLQLVGSGNTIVGGALAGNAGGGSSSLGNSDVLYSTCALKRAMAGNALPVFGKPRSWIQLY